MASADDVLNIARSFLGIKETPVNNVIFNTHYYGKPVSGSEYPWCVVFLWSVFQNANASHLFYGGLRTAYAPTLMHWFKSDHNLDMNGRKGDIAFFDFDGDKLTDHVGLVESVSNGYVTTIDGNTSAQNESNGGMVARRCRPLSTVIGFGHPRYDAEQTEIKPFAVKVTASDFLNIRRGPGTNYGIKQIFKNGRLSDCFLLPGMEVVIHEESDGWGRLAGTNGWVSLLYCGKL